MRKAFCKVLLGFCLFVGVVGISVPANADITITPTRVLFEGRDRFQDVILINTSGQQKTYQMGWRFYRMQETGTPYAAVDSSLTEFDLAEHLVFTPRRVTLPAGGKQKVRLALRRPAEEIPPGDYRTHLEFSGVLEPVTGDSENATGQTSQSSAAVRINVGYSIPVLFRSGESDVTAEIESMELVRMPGNGKLKAVIPVARLGGPFSVMGHLLVYYQGSNGEEELVGEISNAHIFPEVDRRVYDVVLLKDNLSGGSLRVVLKHYDKEKKLIYDEKIYPLN